MSIGVSSQYNTPCRNNDKYVRDLIVNYILNEDVVNLDILLRQNNIDIHYNNEFLSRYACKYGSLNILKYLLEHYPDINIHAGNNDSIKQACVHNRVNIVEYLLYNFESINVHTENEILFKTACMYGSLDVVKYLIYNFSDIDIHNGNDYAFKLCCEYAPIKSNKHYEVARFLKYTFPNINHHNVNISKCRNNEIKYLLKNENFISRVKKN